MNQSFRVALHPGGEGDFATLYSFYLGDRQSDELTRFLSNEAYAKAPDFPVLVFRLHRMLTELGLYHVQADFGPSRYFRDEGEGTSALWAPIPVEDRRRLRSPYPSLRLYCFRVERILVAGYGGIKRTRRVEEDPILQESLKTVKHVSKRLIQRIQAGSVRTVEDGFLLEGDLVFQPESTLP